MGKISESPINWFQIIIVFLVVGAIVDLKGQGLGINPATFILIFGIGLTAYYILKYFSGRINGP